MGSFFIRSLKIRFAKPVLSAKEQVELLQSRGLIIPDTDRAERYLLSIGYYRLSAYYKPFQISSSQTHEFVPNVCFDDILELYIFDRKLRCLFWEALERIEIRIRTQWIYNLTGSTKDPFAHLDASNFSSFQTHTQSFEKLKSSIQRSNSEACIARFFDHYDEELPPLWSCVHLMTFGELILWIQNTTNSEIQNNIAKSLGFVKFYPFESFAVALTELRNVCAHHTRLWNRIFTKRPKKVKKMTVSGFEQYLPVQPSNKLYPFALLPAAALKANSPQTSWPSRLGELLSTRPEQQVLTMGFPSNWKDLALWKPI